MRAAFARRGVSRGAATAVGRVLQDRRFRMLPAVMLWVQIAYMTIDFAPPAPPLAQVSVAPNPLARVIKLVLLALGAAVALSRMVKTRGVLRELNRPFLFFIGLAVLSGAWSIDRPVTAARLVALASMVMVCFAFGVGAWHPRRFQDVVRPALTLILVASLIMGMVDPSWVREIGNTISLKNAWRGLTSQKNVFGELSSLGVIFWLHAWLAREVRPYRALVGTAIAWTCLILSRSSTSLFCTVFATLFLLIIMQRGPTMRRYMPYIVVLFSGACVTYSLAVMNMVPGLQRLIIEPLLQFTGKNLTFSGRTQIWQIINQNIARHPYLGSGFGAYWGAGPVPSSPSYQFVTSMWGFWPTEAHNGYYDMRNDLGIVGLFCLFGYMFVYLRQSLRLIRFDRIQATLFLALLFQQTLLNLTESTWLDLDNFCFTIMTAATVSLARALFEHQRIRSSERSAAAEMQPRSPVGSPRIRARL